MDPPDRYDVLDAWVRYLSEYHRGMGDWRYRRLSKILRKYKPRRHLTPAAKRIYWRLCLEQP